MYFFPHTNKSKFFFIVYELKYYLFIGIILISIVKMANKTQMNSWLKEFNDYIILNDNDDSTVDPYSIESLDHSSGHEIMSDLGNNDDPYDTDDNVSWFLYRQR